MQPKEAHYQSDDRRSTADRNDLPRQPNCAEASDSSFNSKRSIGNDGPSNPRASSGTSRIHHLHPIEKRTPHHQIHRTCLYPVWCPSKYLSAVLPGVLPSNQPLNRTKIEYVVKSLRRKALKCRVVFTECSNCTNNHLLHSGRMNEQSIDSAERNH